MIEDSDWLLAYKKLFEEGILDDALELIDKDIKKVEEEKDKFCLDDRRMICRKVPMNNGNVTPLPFIPFEKRRSLVEKIHKGFGHIGIDGTVATIRRRYWWPNIKKNVL